MVVFEFKLIINLNIKLEIIKKKILNKISL